MNPHIFSHEDTWFVVHRFHRLWIVFVGDHYEWFGDHPCVFRDNKMVSSYYRMNDPPSMQEFETSPFLYLAVESL